MNMKHIAAKYLFDGYNLLQNKVLVFQNQVLQDILDIEDCSKVSFQYLGEGVITPGFFDLQLNGCGGALFNADISAQSLEIMYQTWLRFGTTNFLPTLITTGFAEVKQALNVVNSWIEQYGLLRGVAGIHLEGPFISTEKPGIHDQKFIIMPIDKDLEYIANFAKIFPVKITIAPEVFHMKQIKYLAAAGVIVSMGHSNASYEVAKQAIANGVCTATHLFNAMSGFSGRSPGVVGAVLNTDIYTGIIVDLLHVDSANIEIIHKVKGDKLYIVTDAVTPAGTNLSEFIFAGKRLLVKNGSCVDGNGVLGGANITMNESIHNCVTKCNIPLLSALKMATINPARLMRLDNRLGMIKVGQLSNLVYMDLDDFSCQLVI